MQDQLKGIDLFDFRTNSETSSKVCDDHARIWKELSRGTKVEIFSTIKDAVELLQERFGDTVIVVTGSFYLAGTVRYLLGSGGNRSIESKERSSEDSDDIF